jgi:hypothetical protein
MKDGQVVLIVDFDGTICEHAFPAIGEPKPKAVEVMQALDKAGFKIIIHTCRSNPEISGQEKSDQYIKEMEDWLKEKQIPYDEVWRGTGKPIGHLYIDDHAIPFTSWDAALDMILTMMNYVKTGKATLPATEGGKDVKKAKVKIILPPGTKGAE